MTIDNAPPEFAQIPEASRRFGLSRSRLYILAGEGVVRFVKAGNATLVDLGSGTRLPGELSACVDPPIEGCGVMTHIRSLAEPLAVLSFMAGTG